MQGSTRLASLLTLGLLCLGVGPALAQAAAATPYPLIRRLDASDLVFRQIADAAAQGRRAEVGAAPWPDFYLVAYRIPAETDIFSLAARLDLSYETLSTLNRLASSGPIAAGTLLVIPSSPGLFVAEAPRNDLEHLVAAGRVEEEGVGLPVEVRLPEGAVRFRYLAGARFNASERAFFLNVRFRYPLPKGRLTSGFGLRASPFSGKPSMHAGIDLAAPTGTAVYAARAGTVTESGFDPVYGNYIVVEHEGGWSTLYGHLSKRLAALHEVVASGMIIGEVGSTGLSTGPHLHFEVRLRGSARDPAPVLPRKSP